MKIKEELEDIIKGSDDLKANANDQGEFDYRTKQEVNEITALFKKLCEEITGKDERKREIPYSLESMKGLSDYTNTRNKLRAEQRSNLKQLLEEEE